MTSQVIVFLGPARSGKTHELMRQYRLILDRTPRNGSERVLWLAPNGRTAAGVREQLVTGGLDACLRPGIITFDDLTAEILIAANARLRRLDAATQRELLRRVVVQAIDDGKLPFLADAASRPGFILLLAEHIAELKRRDIGPDAFAHTESRRASAQQAELAGLYADYESVLAAHGLIDRETAQWAARAALADNTFDRFRDLELVVADGFSDFTSAERDILALISQNARQLLIALPADTGGNGLAATGSDSTHRSDLFAKPLATLAELQRDHPQLEVRPFECRPTSCLAIDYIAQQIFGHPKYLEAPSEAALNALGQLEIVEAAGAHDEVLQIARRVKALLTCSAAKQPPRPSDILVVYRSLADVAPRIREVFERFGIPYYLDQGRPIATAAVVQTLFELLLLDQEDWGFRRLISVLTNITIGAFDGESRRAADWLVRDLQIVSGRGDLLDKVQSLAADPSTPSQRSDHVQRRVEAATSALPIFMRLATTLASLPKETTPVKWCEALSRLGADLGIFPFANAAPPCRTDRFSDQLPATESERLAETDRAAWHSLTAHFAALERLDAWLGQPPRTLTRRDLLAALRDVARNESLPRAFEETGRVRILAAKAARNISARHLVLAGMSEQAFPAPERAGRLATDADYQHFARGSHPRTVAVHSPAATRAQEEMLLFYEVLSRAEETLTISYSALDDKGQTLPPSPYIVELERLFTKEQRGRIQRSKPQLSPVASDPTPYSVADWRLQAVARATGKDRDHRLLAGIFSCHETKPLARSVDAGLRIVHGRARSESFGPEEGLLASPAIANRLSQRFGPQHAWSASQWETYATCPFRFFMQHVLGLEPLGDLVLETDFARRGSRLHDVLAAFHRQWLTIRTERSISPDEEAAAFLNHLQQVANERTTASSRIGIDAALLELDRRQILKWANHHFENQAKYDSGCEKLGVTMDPNRFEFRFGPERVGGSEADPNSTKTPFILQIGNEPIQITGQIDRIDVGTLDDKTYFNVIDYKSSRHAAPKRNMLETGQQLQLPIYVEAAQALVFKNDAMPLQAGYWNMQKGFNSKDVVNSSQDDGPTWLDTQATVHNLIRTFIDNIRQGNFRVDSRDNDCTSTCDYRMTCRISQVRSLKKTQWSETDNAQ